MDHQSKNTNQYLSRRSKFLLSILLGIALALQIFDIILGINYYITVQDRLVCFYVPYSFRFVVLILIASSAYISWKNYDTNNRLLPTAKGDKRLILGPLFLLVLDIILSLVLTY